MSYFIQNPFVVTAPSLALFWLLPHLLALSFSEWSAGGGAGSGFQSVWQSLIHPLSPTEGLLTQESPNFSKDDFITSFPTGQPVIKSITLINIAKES